MKFVQRTLGHATASVLFDWYAFVTKHEEDEAVADLERWFVEEQAAVMPLSSDAGGNGGLSVELCQ